MEYILTKDAKTFDDGVKYAREAEANLGLMYTVKPRPTLQTLERNKETNNYKQQTNNYRSSSDNYRDPRIPSWKRAQNKDKHDNYKNKDSKITCYYCKKIGHISANCRKKLFAEKRCFFCKLEGHRQQTCPRKSQMNTTNYNSEDNYKQPTEPLLEFEEEWGNDGWGN